VTKHRKVKGNEIRRYVSTPCNGWFPPSRIRFRKNRVRTLPFMPLLPRRVRGNSAAGPGGRAPSFPRKRVGGAPGAYKRQVRKNRTRAYMKGLYRKKLHTVYPMLYKPTLKNSKN